MGVAWSLPEAGGEHTLVLVKSRAERDEQAVTIMRLFLGGAILVLGVSLAVDTAGPAAGMLLAACAVTLLVTLLVAVRRRPR